tara:strand:+ start:4523 stop:5098 length:576 start_codon:yes stop_codon:yes gene_type:complete
MPSVRITFTPSQKNVLIKVVDEEEALATFKLKAKKTLDGNIIIFDHDDIDIILRPEQKKIVTFKKDDVNGDVAYGAADRMFKYLASRGVINIATVQGGETLDSFQVTIPETNLEVPIKLIMLSIAKWIEKERPYFEYGEDYEDMMRDRLIEPDDEEATELGEVPHDKSKGSIVPGYYRSPYWMSYILEQKE